MDDKLFNLLIQNQHHWAELYFLQQHLLRKQFNQETREKKYWGNSKEYKQSRNSFKT
jgi:hypothetical protein